MVEQTQRAKWPTSAPMSNVGRNFLRIVKQGWKIHLACVKTITVKFSSGTKGCQTGKGKQWKYTLGEWKVTLPDSFLENWVSTFQGRVKHNHWVGYLSVLRVKGQSSILQLQSYVSTKSVYSLLLPVCRSKSHKTWSFVLWFFHLLNGFKFISLNYWSLQRS